MTLFVDTTVWYPAADSGDRSNTRAKAILGSKEPLVTTDHVLVETWVLLRKRLSRAAADRFWEGLRSGVANLEPVGLAISSWRGRSVSRSRIRSSPSSIARASP